MEYICDEARRLHQATIIVKVMKIFSIRTLIGAAVLTAGLVFLVPEKAEAQSYTPVPVTISKEKVKIDGKVCYSHIVLEKQTLYSISKAYNVSIEDIYRFNPTLKETGLKKNGIIIIPSAEALEAAPAVQEAAVETAEVTAKTVAETPAQESAAKESAKKIKRKTHTVKWFEDLDVIAEKYGVKVESIMKLNNLENRKLSNRQKLLIPNPDEIIETPEVVPDTTEQAETTEEKTEEIIVEESPAEVEDSAVIIGKDVKAALLLPLNATGSSSHRGNMDFYSGVLLAVSDLTEKGINVDLKVCDIGGENGLPSYSYIRDCDFVIGPIASGDLTKMLDMHAGHGPYIISPLDQRAQNLAETYVKMIQAPTPHATQYKDLIDWLKGDVKENDKVIFITEKGARPTDAMTQMQVAIDSCGIAYRNFSYSILEGRDIMDPLMSLMTNEGENRVVIASESEAFVNDVVRNLNLIEYQKYEVVLYTSSKIRGFETIEVDNIHNTSLHTSLSYYINYEDPRVMSFLMKYRALFNTEPTQFAFQGYDLATYFVELVNKYGDNWAEKMTESSKKMLQSSFKFKKTPEGGYINNGVRRIVYGDRWSITELN